MRHIYHGDTGTRLYRIWKGIKMRCSLKTHPTYPSYGGRGIQVCPEWIENYPAFKEWALNNGYADDLELDRIDVDGGYSPKNCRWISHHEQTLNRRDTLYIAYNGRTERFVDFCRTHSINQHTVNGWRHMGILDQKLEEKLGYPVRVRQRREMVGKCDF